ncbi:hypothetical protein BC835DRAFT_31981 [Cytidiella melzeri]|nr:hypothetical protein BC835DRAFT_31981 [Cytidiella melzeri]
MSAATFEFDLDKMGAALEYLGQCFKWLAGEGDKAQCVGIAKQLNFQEITQATKSLLQNISDAQTRLTPINRLPSEILGAIFEHVLDPNFSADVSLKLMDFKWLDIQSVCRHWRDVALTTPVLWSHVRIVYPYRESFPKTLLINLGRSGTVPLSICLRDEGDGTIVCLDLMDNFEPHTWRIRELHMERIQFADLDFYLREAHQLELLDVDNPLQPEGYVQGSVTGRQWQAPRLSTFIARNFTHWHEAAFRALRHLVLVNQQFDIQLLHGFYRVLEENPRLEDLVLHEIKAKMDALLPLNMLHLRRISTKNMPDLIDELYYFEFLPSTA